MEKQARILTQEELRTLSMKALIADRFLQRDVHYTISSRRSRETFMVGGKPLLEFSVRQEHVAVRKQATVTFKSESFLRGGFRVVDDKAIYYFEEGWPSEYARFLGPEDATMPSGYETLNESEKELRRVLDVLKRENVTMAMVSIPEQGIADLFSGDVRKRIADSLVNVPVDDLEAIHWAIYSGERSVTDMIARKPIFFTKPLKRTDGKKVEMYNQLLGVWEPEEGQVFGIPWYAKIFLR